MSAPDMRDLTGVLAWMMRPTGQANASRPVDDVCVACGATQGMCELTCPSLANDEREPRRCSRCDHLTDVPERCDNCGEHA